MHAKPYNWTPARIRAATPHPKPEGELAKLDRLLARPPEQDTADFIIRVLADADLLDVETVDAFGHSTRWLLVPVGYAELELLAGFAAHCEDLEDNGDQERDDEREPEDYEGGAQPRLTVHVASDQRPAVPVTVHEDLTQWRKV